MRKAVYQTPTLKRGDLVRIWSGTSFDDMFTVIALVIECRHKTHTYRILPCNSPLGDFAYWVARQKLELLSRSTAA